MLCPACHAPLSSRGAAELSLQRCSTCSGLWLDNVASQRVSAGRLSEAARAFILEVERESQPSAGSAPERTGPRACPSCQTPLAEVGVPYTDVRVDVCAAHGTFFDALELYRVHQAIEIKNVDDADAAGEFAKDLADERFHRAMHDSALHRALRWLRN